MADNKNEKEDMQANCPKCKKPAAKFGLLEIVRADGKAEAYRTFLCAGCDFCFDIPRLKASC